MQGHWLSAREGGKYSCLVQNKSGSTIMYGQATVTFQEGGEYLGYYCDNNARQ